MKIFISITIIACSAALLSSNARAVSEVDLNNTTDTYFDHLITPGLATDLIYNNVGTLTDGALPPGNTDTGPDIDFTVKGLTDGLSTDGTDPTQTFFGTTHFANAYGQPSFGNSLNYDPIVTYTLGTSPTGYTINSIQSIFGYTNESSFADQNFTIQYTTVGDSFWQTLTSVAYNPFAPPSTDVLSGTGATDVTLTGNALATAPLATGVTEIRFEFSPYIDSSVDTGSGGQEQFGQVIRELEVDGAVTIPEPSTWGMMVVGAAGIITLSFRRLLRA
jgi:hypothetical protein